MTINPELLHAIRKTNNFVLATHINPDGDALGSLLGLADILEAMGKRVLRFLEKPVSHLYHFLPGTERIHSDVRDLHSFSRQAGHDIMSIALDCGDRGRLGDNSPNLLAIRPAAIIDHHKGNDCFGDICWVEPHRSSTGEMIADLATALDQELSKNAATCLYTAIVTDTGSFQYESVTAHTFAVAEKLVRTGIRPAAIMQELFDNYTLERVRLMQLVLATLEVYDHSRIAVIRVTAAMFRTTATSLEDTENFINLVRAIKPVQVAVFLKETATGHISVSLRGKGTCDLSRVASQFGGGGHRNAAGFRDFENSIDQVRDHVVSVLQRELSAAQ